jgi:hypothetical protein
MRRALRHNGRRKGETKKMDRAAVARFLKSETELNQQLERDYLTTGIRKFDSSLRGLPRGAITEIYGPATSGKTSFLHTFLGTATLNGEFCALVDASNTFDPHAAAAVNADLSRLLWVRCIDAVQALKSVDLLVHSGGWGVIVLDLGTIQPQIVRKLPISYWYRFRRAVENTPTAFLVLEHDPFVKNCAAMTIEMAPAKAKWTGRHKDFKLLQGIDVCASPRKPMRSQKCDFLAQALA